MLTNETHRAGGESYAVHATAEASHTERVAVTISSVVFSFDGQKLRVLTLRGHQNLKLPVRSFEQRLSADAMASLLLDDVIGVQLADNEMTQVGVYSESKQGEGALVISYYTVLPRTMFIQTSQNPLQPQLHWADLTEIAESGDKLVHEQVLTALRNLRMRARFENVAFSFLPIEFSLGELQHLFEAVIGRQIDVRNFRKKIDSLDILTETATRQTGLAHRPPKLYSFDSEKFKKRVEAEGEVRFF